MGGGKVIRVTCTLSLTYDREAEAQAIHAAIAVDNEAYCTSRVHEAAVQISAGASSAASALHTLDDVLACISAAESTYRSADSRRAPVP